MPRTFPVYLRAANLEDGLHARLLCSVDYLECSHRIDIEGPQRSGVAIWYIRSSSEVHHVADLVLEEDTLEIALRLGNVGVDEGSLPMNELQPTDDQVIHDRYITATILDEIIYQVGTQEPSTTYYAHR